MLPSTPPRAVGSHGLWRRAIDSAPAPDPARGGFEQPGPRPGWSWPRPVVGWVSVAVATFLVGLAIGFLAAHPPGGPGVLVAPVLMVLVGIVVTQRARHAVDELIVAERSSRRSAATDALTGLTNRRGFVDHLGAALDAGTGGDEVGIAFIDLDRFKLFNDVHGHSAGDQLLRAVGARIAAVADGRPAARLGGDEFAVVFRGAAASIAHEGDDLGARILTALGRPFEVDGLAVTVDASIGIADLRGSGPGTAATPPDQGHPVALDLLRRADLAQYQAKSLGGARVVRHTDALDLAVQRSARVIEALRDGGGELGVVFQAIVRTRDGVVVGAESLARLTSAALGEIPATEFIVAAERNGLIIPVGRQVLDLVVEELRSVLDRLPEGFRVSINVSPLQLDDSGGTAELEDLAIRSPEVVAHLRIEVTESALATDVTRRAVARLSAAGFQIAIDDFGSDYASLQYLATMHVDVLKLDRSFVARALTQASVDTAIIRHVVELAGELGVEVVAEGVETDEQAELVSSLGCTYGQGYRWDRPASGLGRLVGDTSRRSAVARSLDPTGPTRRPIRA